MRHSIEGNWFGLVDLACVSVAIICWELKPEFQGWPIFLALLPWVLRVGAGNFPFYRTCFDIPILIFVLTALLGVIIAYNPIEAINKFWLVIGGILLFYAIAGQTPGNLRIVAIGTSVIGPGMAILFLLTNNWSIYPAKIDFLNKVGLEWMKFRPTIPSIGIDPHPNLASGVIAFTTPFLVYFGLEAWKDRNFSKMSAVVVGASLSMLGLLLATSRGAVISLAVGLGVWLMLLLARRWGIKIPANRRKLWFVLGLIFTLTALWLIYSFIGRAADLEVNFSADSTTTSRLELSHSVISLLGDFPFSGGGLNSFSGLYSNYIQVIPSFKVINSHNQFLDIALEQGPVGLLAFLLIYFGSFWLLWNQSGVCESSWLVKVTCASLVIICIHGFFDDFIYNSWLTPLIFFLPGIICAITRSHPEDIKKFAIVDMIVRYNPKIRRWHVLVVSVIFFTAFLIYFYANSTSILASLYANIGAIEMAKVELANFPSNSWSAGQNTASLRPAEAQFMQAHFFDSRNRTANHRLGLIAVSKRDFQAAVPYLEAAYQSDPSYRGIWKSLGYAYVWVGEYDQALAMLEEIPEARQEMGVYAWWWQTQRRDDLAKNAEIMSSMITRSK